MLKTIILLLTLPTFAFATDIARPELRDGDRVVWLGGTLIEREQRYGYWETALTARHPDKHITFRNLGWSGDTVWAESRGMFDPPAEGYKRMLAQVRGLKPTLIILGYGRNESFAGKAGLESFLTQYRKLLADLREAAGTEVRFVMLSPVRQVPIPVSPERAAKQPRTPDESDIFEVLFGVSHPVVTENNRRIALYTAALQDLAQEQRIPFGKIWHLLEIHQRDDGTNAATDDGIVPNATGYKRSADQIEAAICSSISLTTLGKIDQFEALRHLIVAKNRLYFQQWRPQNITYLTGFRKHEQGQNAAELAEFDRLIAEKEREIAALLGP